MELEKITAELRADTSQFVAGMSKAVGVGQKALSKITGAGKQLRGELNAVGNSALGLKTMLASVGAGVIFKNLISSGASFEAQMSRLEAQVKATGGAAGLSAKEINDFARSLGESTLASAKGVRDAAGVLLTFKSIAGNTFKETLRLAQDMSAVGFGDIRTTALQLAKALEEPTIGLTMLRRSGVSFTESQKELIKSLVESNKLHEAQQVILSTVSGQLKGAATGAAKGYAGVLDTLNERITKLFEDITTKYGVLDTLSAVFYKVSKNVKDLTGDVNAVKGWAEFTITGIDMVIKGVGFLKTAWQGITLVWKGLEMGWEGLKLLILNGIDVILKELQLPFDAVNKFGSVIGSTVSKVNSSLGEAIKSTMHISGGFEESRKAIGLWKDDTSKNIADLKEEFINMIPAQTGMQQADAWIEEIRKKAAAIRADRLKAESESGTSPTTTTEPPAAPATKEDQARAARYADNLKNLRDSLKSEMELQIQANEDMKAENLAAYEAGEIDQEEYYANIRAIAEDHQNKMAEINQNASDAERKINKQRYEEGIGYAGRFFNSMMALSQNKNKQLFKIAKAGAIATAVVDTYTAAANALAQLPYPVNILAAVAVTLEGLQRVNAIRSTSYGGGGGGAAGGGGGNIGAGAAGGGAVSQPGVSAPSYGPSVAAGTQVNINLGDEDGLVSKRTIRNIMDGIGDQIKDGGTITGITVS